MGSAAFHSFTGWLIRLKEFYLSTTAVSSQAAVTTHKYTDVSNQTLLLYQLVVQLYQSRVQFEAKPELTLADSVRLVRLFGVTSNKTNYAAVHTVHQRRITRLMAYQSSTLTNVLNYGRDNKKKSMTYYAFMTSVKAYTARRDPYKVYAMFYLPDITFEKRTSYIAVSRINVYCDILIIESRESKRQAIQYKRKRYDVDIFYCPY
ncbi:hypothetical protein CBL_03578 [Carabus blaptoides fortunei]